LPFQTGICMELPMMATDEPYTEMQTPVRSSMSLRVFPCDPMTRALILIT